MNIDKILQLCQLEESQNVENKVERQVEWSSSVFTSLLITVGEPCRMRWTVGEPNYTRVKSNLLISTLCRLYT